MLPSSRRLWLVGSVLLAWAVLLVPSLLVSTDRQPVIVPFVQVLACGLLLGVGRQGVDVLVVRLLLVAPVVIVGWVVGSHLHSSGPLCSDLQGVSCLQGMTLAVLFGGFLTAMVFALIAFPTTLVWSRDFASLRPELPWKHVPWPRNWWGWVLLSVAILVLLGAFYISLGIPAY